MANTVGITVQGGRVWSERTGAGTGRPLLVIHGIPGTSSRYLRDLDAVGADRPVIFYDQLGGGRSDRPADASLWTVDRFVSEVEDVRRALGLDDVHVLGHSWGGILALEHALAGAPGIRSLTLASVPVSIPDYVADIRRLRAQLPAAVQAMLDRHEADGTQASEEYQSAVQAFRMQHVCRPDPWPGEFAAALADINPDVFVTLWGPDPFDCTGLLRDYDRTADLAKLPVPVLLTAGRYDVTTPDRAQQHCCAVKDGRVVVFERSAHVAMAEEPEAYVTALRAFLRSVDDAGS